MVKDLGDQADILHARGDLDGAMALYKEQERLCRELGKKAGLQFSLGTQANILHARGDFSGVDSFSISSCRVTRLITCVATLSGTTISPPSSGM